MLGGQKLHSLLGRLGQQGVFPDQPLAVVGGVLVEEGEQRFAVEDGSSQAADALGPLARLGLLKLLAVHLLETVCI